MPALRKIDKQTYDATIEAEKRTKTCEPVIEVIDGNVFEVKTDMDGTVIKYGKYRWIVLVPDALLGELRWNRIFNRFKEQLYDQAIYNAGVAFCFA